MTSWGNTASDPAYGECPHLLWRRRTSIFEVSLISNTAMSASYPSAMAPFGIPNSLPGLYEPILTASDNGIVPLRTISMIMGIVVSTPGMPDGASWKSLAFSSAVWGA